MRSARAKKAFCFSESFHRSSIGRGRSVKTVQIRAKRRSNLLRLDRALRDEKKDTSRFAGDGIHTSRAAFMALRM